MLDLLPLNGPSRIWSPGAVVGGTLGTVGLFAVTLVSAPQSRAPDRKPLTHHVEFLLPPKPGNARGYDERIYWIPPIAVPGAASQSAGDGPVAALPKGRRRPQPGVSRVHPPTAEDPDAGHVYIASAVDKKAVRNPASGAPVYPPFLEATGIEGYVTVQFVVDTVGRVDSVSFRVVEVTHPAFAEAVRAALSSLLFSPAEIDGRPVRQLVRQTFRFVLQRGPQLAALEGAALPLIVGH